MHNLLSFSGKSYFPCKNSDALDKIKTNFLAFNFGKKY